MKIRLHDADSKIPNLALMRLSAFWKGQGADVDFWRGEPADRVYVSTVFTRTQPDIEALRALHPEVIIGGTGWDVAAALPDEVEASRPDYSLYGIDYGLGFLWRGCANKCAFCYVPRKEGAMRQVATLADLINPKSNRLILLDNNLTAAPNVVEILAEIADRHLTVNFNQGLDIRRVTPEIAAALARVRFSNHTFKRDSLHFAFDQPALEADIRRGVRILAEAGIKPYRLTVYMLCGYNTTFEQDMHRFNVLRELGCDPYVMIYNDRGDHQLRHFDRWVNGRVYKADSWDHYQPWARERDQIRFA